MQWVLDIEKKSIKEAFASPLLYVLLVIFALWSFYALGATMYAVMAFCLAFLLILMSVIDLKHMILPDLLMWPFITLCFLFSPFLGYGYIYALIGFGIGFGLFYAIHWGFYKIKGYHGLGFGDVKLLGGIGAMASATSLPLVLILASFSALFAFILRALVFDKKGNVPMPFGPFLALGAWICFLYGGLLWQYFFDFRNMLVTVILGEGV